MTPYQRVYQYLKQLSQNGDLSDMVFIDDQTAFSRDYADILRVLIR